MIKFIKDIEKNLKKELPGEQSQIKMSPEIRYAENISSSEKGARESAVMILVFGDNDMYDKDLQIVLIKRNDDGQPHSGQIAFPGGKYEDKDKNLINTAKRETYEEVGVLSEKITVLGKLTPLYIPVSNFNVCPIVAYSPENLEFTPDHSEVAYIIKVKISDLLNAKIHKKKIKRYGKEFVIPYFDFNNEHVWGATAMILNEFRDILNK